MMFFQLSSIFATVNILILGFQTVVRATEPDYLCYIQTSSGQVVDLSNFCTTQKSSLTAVTGSEPVFTDKDQAFIEEYKRQIKERPDVDNRLLANIEQSPQTNIEEAKRVCHAQETGLTPDEIQQVQVQNTSERADIVNANIIKDLASKYYCSKTPDTEIEL